MKLTLAVLSAVVLTAALVSAQQGIVTTGEVAGTPIASEAHEVMDRAHYLQMAALEGSIQSLLAGKTVIGFLGATWLAKHPSVKPSLESFLVALREHKHV